MQCSPRIDLSAADDRSLKAIVSAEFDQGGSDAEELGHGCGCEELVAVLLVNRQSAADVNHEKAPVAVLVARGLQKGRHLLLENFRL